MRRIFLKTSSRQQLWSCSQDGPITQLPQTPDYAAWDEYISLYSDLHRSFPLYLSLSFSSLWPCLSISFFFSTPIFVSHFFSTLHLSLSPTRLFFELSSLSLILSSLLVISHCNFYHFYYHNYHSYCKAMLYYNEE